MSEYLSLLSCLFVRCLSRLSYLSRDDDLSDVFCVSLLLDVLSLSRLLWDVYFFLLSVLERDLSLLLLSLDLLLFLEL